MFTADEDDLNAPLKEGEIVAGMNNGDVKKKVHRLDTLPIEEFPLFMNSLPNQQAGSSDGENVPLAALQALLYEGTPEEQALNFKNQGNECYALGPKGLRDSVRFYTRGIDTKCSDPKLMATLHLNRSAANLALGNVGDALRDAQSALAYDSDDMKIKANQRILKTALHLQRAAEARTALDSLKASGEKVKQLEEEALAVLEAELEKEQQARIQAEHRLEETRKIVKGLGLALVAGAERALLEHFGPASPLVQQSLPTVRRVGGRTVWPVLLFYPDDAQSDLLEAVDVDSRLFDILRTVFDQPPEWDTRERYGNVQELVIYWHSYSKEDDRLVRLDPQLTIRDLLGSLIKVIDRGILPFYICPPDPSVNSNLIARFRTLETFPQ